MGVSKLFTRSTAIRLSKIFNSSSSPITITGEIQKVANIALKIITGNGCSPTAVRRDLNIPPIQATAAGAQSRALAKFPMLKTEVARILNCGRTRKDQQAVPKPDCIGVDTAERMESRPADKDRPSLDL
ncbi:MAG: uncharacterized protein A8A55_2268 [Amphiamblys sp. WSBS2006]|nr:MAG: uncharacterized protein A8A55_2268 [Amphiamblys sp. WSBS2006]